MYVRYSNELYAIWKTAYNWQYKKNALEQKCPSKSTPFTLLCAAYSYAFIVEEVAVKGKRAVTARFLHF